MLKQVQLLFLLLPAGARKSPSLLPFCEASALAAAQCGDPEHGMDWGELLAYTCERCPQGRPCKLKNSDPAVIAASNIVNGKMQGELRCLKGLLSAVILVAQVYLVRIPSELERFFSVGSSLAPFPFHTSQYELYTSFVPARLMHCAPASEAELENKYMPRVHPEDSGTCGLVFTDTQLVRQCRSRRRSMARPAPSPGAAGLSGNRSALLRSLRCPDEEITVDLNLGKRIEKYQDRAEAQQCQTLRGMWRQEMSAAHKCVLITVAQMMGFRPGQLVLDWGSGCGHKLSWAKALFDVEGLGVEIVGTAVTWAREHSLGTFCNADGRDLNWIPDGLFDHVISYAALGELSKDDQCSSGRQLVRKLRVGGRAWFGWNYGTGMTTQDWWACFDPQAQQNASLPKVEFEAIEDGFLFPPDAEATGDILLFQYPAYSIFLTRLP